MHHTNVIEIKATGAELVIELGYIPAHAIIKNVTNGSQVEYVNTRLGMHQMSIDAGAVTNDIDDGEYIGTDGILANDGLVKRTAQGSIGYVASTAAGLVLGILTDINDTDGEQLVIIATRSEI